MIAEHADIETMSILASTQPLKVSYDLSPELVLAGLDILGQRRDYDEKLSAAFDDLITIAQARESEAGSVDSLLESGRFFSAKSSFHTDLAEALSTLHSPIGSDPEESADRASERTDESSEDNVPLVTRASTF